MTEVGKRASHAARGMTPAEFYSLLANQPRGLALETGRCSTQPDAVQQFATAMQANFSLISAALTNIAAGVLALDAMITAFNNSSGTLSSADQASLTALQAASSALVTQVQAISTAPPGTTAPVVPVPTPTP